VLVNAVCPGWTATDMGAAAAGRWARARRASSGASCSATTAPRAASSATAVRSVG